MPAHATFEYFEATNAVTVTCDSGYAFYSSVGAGILTYTCDNTTFVNDVYGDYVPACGSKNYKDILYLLVIFENNVQF